MCIIIDNRAGNKIDSQIISNCIRINPDGFGIYYTDNGELIYTMDMMEAAELLRVDRPFIAHCRFATTGEINELNLHPVACPDGGLLFQNGTVQGLAHDGLDTRQIANMLSFVKVRSVAKFLASFESRFLLVRPSGDIVRTGNWLERDGVFYSKPNVLKTINRPRGSQLVAVYGTLKRDFHNHRYLESAVHVGDAQTADLYRLCVDGLPYMIREPHENGHYVNVELYAVDKATLRHLDSLEGHPNFYKRERIPFLTYEDESEVEAWCYMTGEDFDSGVYHDAYYGDTYDEWAKPAEC